MAAENISVLLKLRGGKDFRRDANAAGRSVKGITGQSKQLGAQASKTDRAVSKHRRGVAALGTAAKYGGAALGGGLVIGLKRSIVAYNESRKVTAQTENAIKKSGGAANVTARHVDALGTSIMKKTGIDDEQIKTGSNMLLTFKGIRNEVGRGNKIFDRATQAAVDMSATFGGDAQRSAVMLGKALNDPEKGLTKLTRVGVSFTAQEEKKIKAMAKSGNLLGAQKVMLKAINSQGIGGAAAAKATPIDKMKASLGELEETIGGGVSPIVDKAATKLNRFVTGMQAGTGSGGRFVRAMRSLWGAAKPVLSVLGRMVVGIGRFTAAHPALAKLVVSFLALGAAVKVLRFANKATEFSTLVRGARAAPGRIRAALASTRGIVARIMGRAGASGGQRLASTMASTAGSGIGPSFNRRGSKFRTVGHTAGGRLGRAAGSTAASRTSTTAGSSIGPSFNRQGGKFRAAGRIAGGILGKAMGIAAAAAAGAAIGDWLAKTDLGKKFKDKILGQGDLAQNDNKFGLPEGKASGKFYKIPKYDKAKKRNPIGGAMGGQVTPRGIKRFAGGGMVPRGEDTLAGLRYGEFVQRQSAVRREGVGAMRALNEGRAKITMPDRVPVDLGGLMANRAGAAGGDVHVYIDGLPVDEAHVKRVDRKRQRR